MCGRRVRLCGCVHGGRGCRVTGQLVHIVDTITAHSPPTPPLSLLNPETASRMLVMTMQMAVCADAAAVTAPPPAPQTELMNCVLSVAACAAYVGETYALNSAAQPGQAADSSALTVYLDVDVMFVVAFGLLFVLRRYAALRCVALRCVALR